MALLSLKDIGKIYVSENSVAVGIRGINLDFNLGEFVAITGKSGAGKSTLLNILSGMDSYEEGEMYVNGQPTSHYMQSDWEEYRKKYISFIFQDYNIIESFTVLENVELALMHIKDRKERKKKALELIDRVGLRSHIKSRGSKLSGGQKQRTVIARALAKDSPIILADEPTGNLDSATSKEIIDLLHEVSVGKLVIVVTHNYEDFKECATRHIRIYDGGIEADDVIKNVETVDAITNTEETEEKKSKYIKDGFDLGFSIFKSKPRLTFFMCLLMLIGTLVVFVLSAALSNSFKIYQKAKMFEEYNGRVVITHNDGTYITDEELNNLKTKYGLVDYLHIDNVLDIESNTFLFDEIQEYLNAKIVYKKEYGTDVYGRYPEKADECLLYLPISYKPIFGSNELKVSYCTFIQREGQLIKVVGVKYYINNNLTPEVLFTDEGFKTITSSYYYSFASSTVNIEIPSKYYASFNKIEFSSDLGRDEFFIADDAYHKTTHDLTYNLKINGAIQYQKTNPRFEYFDEGKIYNYSFTLDGSKERKTIDSNYIRYGGKTLYLGIDLYNELINKLLENNYTQASLFFKNNNQAKNSISSLKKDGFIVAMSNETYSPNALDTILNSIGSFFGIIGWFLGIVFIGLFINLCTRKSLEAFKNDIGIMRSMGITEKVIKVGTYVRVFLCLIPACIIVFVGSFVFYHIPQTNDIFPYLSLYAYFIILIGILILAYRIAKRQNKRIFNVSVKKAIKGGENHD